MFLLQQVHGRFGVLSELNVVAILQRVAESFAGGLFVIHYQERRGHVRTGCWRQFEGGKSKSGR